MNTIISLSDFIDRSVGVMYRLAPNYSPRNISIIVSKIEEVFKKDAENVCNSFFYHRVPANEVRKFVEDILMQIDEFQELNLSEEEYKNGVKVTDEFRHGNDDFVDLDACIRNIANMLINDHFNEYLFEELGDDEIEKHLKKFYEDKEE